MALPHGGVGWSAVCDRGISDHTHLLLIHLDFRKAFYKATHEISFKIALIPNSEQKIKMS